MKNSLQALIIITSFSLALYLNNLVPFYYSWDMDLLTLLDLFIIPDNQMPAHMAHPGLGMYWILSHAQALAQSIGLITDFSMSTLFNSEQPFLLVAERMYFLRYVHVIICIFLPIFLWLSIRNLLKESRVRETLALLCFLTLPGLWKYNILMIRTEVYALFFWSISLYFLTKSLSSEDDGSSRLNILLAGLFASLSFFTKIQIFFMILLLPFFFQFFNQKIKSQHFTLKNLAFAIFSFFALSVISHNVQMPDHVKSFASSFSPNKFLILTVALLIILYLSSRFKKFNSMNYFIIQFCIGASGVIFFSLTIGYSVTEALRYSILNYKMIFMRHFIFDSVQLQNVWGLFKVHFSANWLIACMLILTCMYLVYKKHHKLSLLAILGLIALQLGMATRSSIQDAIWAQVVLSATFLFLISSLSKRIQTLAMIVLLVWNTHQLTGFKKFTVTQDIAYFDSFMFFFEGYSIGHYQDGMLARYPDAASKNVAVNLGTNLIKIKGYLANNILSDGINLKNVTSIDSKLAIHLTFPHRLAELNLPVVS
jgi:hypothetical protein